VDPDTVFLVNRLRPILKSYGAQMERTAELALGNMPNIGHIWEKTWEYIPNMAHLSSRIYLF
jgi:hypothetical protein